MKKFNDKSNSTGDTIHKYRLLKKFKVTEICRKLELLGININRKDIYSMEKGTMIIKDFELIALAKILDIPFEELTETIFKEYN